MQQAPPRSVLSVWDAVALIIGVVVGAGIFKTPALVASSADGAHLILLIWVLGGLVSLIGALCYAELTTAHPHPGGEYHVLGRAYGRSTAFLFAWTRLLVVQTGSIALLAFVAGDYLHKIAPIAGGSATYAALAVGLFTALNISGVRSSFGAQRLLTVVTVGGLLIIIAAGLAAPPAPPSVDGGQFSMRGASMAMVFVLLTFGGWNEAAYVSAEVRDGARNMVRALLIGIAVITVLYVLVNLSFLRVLGEASLGRAEAPANDAVYLALGSEAAALVNGFVVIIALASLNVTILTGARTCYAMAHDFAMFRWLGHWHDATNTPRTALFAQGGVALLLVLLGASTRDGFETMVEYVSPVFWLFFLLTGIALFVLRWREPHRQRPFRVPGYPLTPALFCTTCALLLYASLSYTGVGALFGVGVLLAGIPILLLARGAGIDHTS